MKFFIFPPCMRSRHSFQFFRGKIKPIRKKIVLVFFFFQNFKFSFRSILIFNFENKNKKININISWYQNLENVENKFMICANLMLIVRIYLYLHIHCNFSIKNILSNQSSKNPHAVFFLYFFFWKITMKSKFIKKNYSTLYADR